MQPNEEKQKHFLSGGNSAAHCTVYHRALNGLNLGFYKVEAAKDGIPLGLDLVGGSEITYEAQIPAGTSAEDAANGINSAVAMLRQRWTCWDILRRLF